MTMTTEKPAFHPARKFSQTLLAAAVAAAALTVLPAMAQSSGAGAASGSSPGSAASGGTSSAGSSATGAPGITSAGTPRAGAGGSTLARNDSKLVIDLAQDNIAEIEVGKLALEKSQNENVKKYAQQMIDDHTEALKELQTLAQSKGVPLPDNPGVKHTAKATAMKALSGAAFDAQYIKAAGVTDHQNNMKLLQKIQKDVKDPEVKAMAVKLLPTVRGHLEMAQKTVATTSSK